MKHRPPQNRYNGDYYFNRFVLKTLILSCLRNLARWQNMFEPNKVEKLWLEISQMRKEVSEAYETDDSTDEVVALSQELDQLLNEFDRLMRNENEK